MNELAVEREHKRLEVLLEKAEVPQQQRDVLAAVTDNLAWQRVKLDETRELIKGSQVVVKYDNGGGQSGVRENPIFKGYYNLWRAYMAGLEKFTSYLPKDMQDAAIGDSLTVLEQVKQMRKAGT